LQSTFFRGQWRPSNSGLRPQGTRRYSSDTPNTAEVQKRPTGPEEQLEHSVESLTESYFAYQEKALNTKVTHLSSRPRAVRHHSPHSYIQHSSSVSWCLASGSPCWHSMRLASRRISCPSRDRSWNRGSYSAGDILQVDH